LYWPQKWKNRFNNGIFTTEIKANKEISVPLQWIKRVPPGQTPPDWDKLKVTPSETQLFLDASAATSVKPDSPTGPTSNPTAPNATGFRNPLGDANYRVGDGLGAGRNHGGVDLAADAGTPVYATKGGTVIISGDVNGYGQVVYIDHGDGTQTRYGHLQEGSRTFRAGQTVTAGQQIGKVGSTGRSTGAHLHYEVRTGTSSSASNDATVPVDAKKYLGR
jgi:murein DD-endopeptidase MepM/ murein hydrolase activator NlpD